MAKKVLVTGASGFIGSSLADELIKIPDLEVVAMDNMRTGNIFNLPSSHHDNYRFVKCDVNNYRDLAEVMLSEKFDYVFHYAALVGVLRTLQNPIEVLDDISGFKHILQLSKNTGVKRFFFSSSSEVYGEPVEFPQHEITTPLNSRLPYAIVKNVGEAYVRSYFQVHGLEYTIFRFFNTYGPKQSEDFVISKFLRNAIANKPIMIYGDGQQTRTFCFINDNIEATLNAFSKNLFINDVVNIGTDNEIKIVDLAELIIKLVGSKSEIVFVDPLKEGDMTRRKPDISRMKVLLNREFISLEAGLAQVINSFKSLKS